MKHFFKDKFEFGRQSYDYTPTPGIEYPHTRVTYTQNTEQVMVEDIYTIDGQEYIARTNKDGTISYCCGPNGAAKQEINEATFNAAVRTKR